MGFEQIISEEKAPLTKQKLKEDLVKLGIKKNDYLLVHSSLNKIGYIIGKELTLVESLIEVVGENGLIVMPTQTEDNSNPEEWQAPPVPKSWCQIIKDNMPAFDPQFTPTTSMGVVPEFFRKYKNVIRSNHPQVSFAAWGPRNYELLKNHPYEFELCDHSPLGLMYNWNFKILMLGTGYRNCTAMHLSEYRANCRRQIERECAVLENNERKWIKYKDLDIDSDCFDEIGNEFEKQHKINIGLIGYAQSRLIDMQTLVDFTTKYLASKF